MRVYYDPSCIIALYCTEPLSASVRAFVSEQDDALLVNELQELEFRNGLRQKVLRQEITESYLSRRHSSRQICRSFDLLHVAIAVASEVKYSRAWIMANANWRGRLA